MKLVRLLAFMTFFFLALPSYAQDESVLYRVADVTVDLSADSAAKARDEAILKAQKQAFLVLAHRLGADVVPDNISDDDVALMVRAFEVQKEHAAGQRYKGTFTVQFKPESVRKVLSGRGVAYTEVRAQPIVVLPVLRQKGRMTLWEDSTAWRNAWDETAKKAVLVPMIVPAGDLDDISKISTIEALRGSVMNFQAMMQKYKAGGAMVAVLEVESELDASPVEGKIQVYSYDLQGTARDTLELEIKPGEETKTLDDELHQAIIHVIDMIEGDWRQAHEQADGVPFATEPSVSAPDQNTDVYLPVDVPVRDLAAWAQTRTKLADISEISSTHVITMTRGLVHIELGFRSDIASLQSALSVKGLRLEQTRMGSWQILQDAGY